MHIKVVTAGTYPSKTDEVTGITLSIQNIRAIVSVMQGLFMLDDFDITKILEELSSIGATSIRILNEDFRMALLKEAEGYTYEPEEEIVGSVDRIVRQQMGSFNDFSDGSKYILLMKSFQNLLDGCLAELDTYPFETRLSFNSMVLQRYEKGSLGITPHRDGLSYINLVCVFNIGGRGRFFICSDRSGSDVREIDTSPGNVVLMRAPGFFGSKNRPFHYVTEIHETRYTFGLRQRSL